MQFNANHILKSQLPRYQNFVTFFSCGNAPIPEAFVSFLVPSLPLSHILCSLHFYLSACLHARVRILQCDGGGPITLLFDAQQHDSLILHLSIFLVK